MLFTTDIIEIDLDINLRKERTDPGEQIGIFVPFPYRRTVYFTLRRKPARYRGERRYFVCEHCNKNKLKLYTLRDVAVPAPIACRECYGLKYDSQYGSMLPFSKRSRIGLRLANVADNHLLEYDGRPTRYGKRVEKLRTQYEESQLELDGWFMKQNARLDRISIC